MPQKHAARRRSGPPRRAGGLGEPDLRARIGFLQAVAKPIDRQGYYWRSVLRPVTPARARRRIGYMRVREYRYLMRAELIPVTREEAEEILRGRRSAREGQAPTEAERRG